MEVFHTLQLLFSPFRIATSIAWSPVAIAVLYFLLGRGSIAAWLQQHRAGVRNALVAVSLGCTLLFVYGAFATVPRQQLPGEDESSILSITAAYLHGQQVYPGLQAPSEYSLLYGPATFLLYTPPMLLHAIQMRWFQAWVGVALVAALLLVLVALRRNSSRALALIFMGYTCMVLGQRAGNEWNIKSDPWIVVFTALGFAAAFSLPVLWADLVIAVAGCVLVDLKANLFLLALLPLVVLSQRSGQPLFRRLPAVALLCLLVLSIFALPHISLTGYLEELGVAGHQGFSRALLSLNMGVFLQALALPFCGALWAAWRMSAAATQGLLRRHSAFLATLSLACVLALASGSKNGAGPWHLLPLAVPFALLDAQLLAIAFAHARLHTRLAAFAPAVWFFTAAMAHGAYSTVEVTQGRHYEDGPVLADVQRDLLDIVHRHPGERIQLAPSGDSGFDIARMRYVLIVAGEPLFSDPDTRNERDAAHLLYAAPFLRAFNTCAVTLWLTPKGSAPLSMHSAYARDPFVPPGWMTDDHLYPSPLPQDFAARYTRAGESRYFDLWTCHPPATP